MQSGAALLCRVRARRCALSLGHVREILRPLPVEPLPGLPAAVLGAAVVRGETMPVVDAGLLLGEADALAPGRFVVLSLGARHGVLAVDEVVGVDRSRLPALDSLPPLLRDADPQVVAALGARDASLLVVLDAARLVPGEVWDAIARGAA